MKFYQTNRSIVKNNYKDFHSYAQRCGIEIDPVKGNGVVDTCRKCGLNCHDVVNILRWVDSKMPFYRVYPAFIDQLESIGADFSRAQTLPGVVHDSIVSGRAICIEMPIDERSLFSESLVSTALLEHGGEPTIGISLRTSDTRLGNKGGFALGRPIEHISDRSDDSNDCNRVTRQASLIYLAILAIGDNPDLIQPIPLAKDRDRYEKTCDERFIEKARRRGINGFEVGKVLQDEKNAFERIRREGGIVSPHYRRSHLALQHYGKERSQTKIVLRKGSFVNFEKIKNVPMGYYR